MIRKTYVKKVKKRMANAPEIFFTINTCYYYKRICVETKPGFEDVFDISTDIWRPLTLHEMRTILDYGFEHANKKIIRFNEVKKLQENRRLFQIASAKQNSKEKEFYYNIAMRAIKKLRSLL